MIKRLLFFLTLMLASLTMYATPQEEDVIYIDGAIWFIESRPISADSLLLHDLKAALPEDHVTSSSNWEGYTAYWSIRQEYLCLDSIKYRVYDKVTEKVNKVCMPADILHRVFKKHTVGNRIIATWFHEDIRMGSGNIIYQFIDGYERNYENEQFIRVDRGKVTNIRSFHNYISEEGFSFDNYHPKNIAELREKFPVHFERFPELAGVKQVFFNIREARIDSTGRMVECVGKATYRKDDKMEEHPGIAAEIAEALKAYYPWRVSFINGKYRGVGIEGWVIPFLIDDKE